MAAPLGFDSSSKRSFHLYCAEPGEWAAAQEKVQSPAIFEAASILNKAGTEATLCSSFDAVSEITRKSRVEEGIGARNEKEKAALEPRHYVLGLLSLFGLWLWHVYRLGPG